MLQAFTINGSDVVCTDLVLIAMFCSLFLVNPPVSTLTGSDAVCDRDFLYLHTVTESITIKA